MVGIGQIPVQFQQIARCLGGRLLPTARRNATGCRGVGRASAARGRAGIFTRQEHEQFVLDDRTTEVEGLRGAVHRVVLVVDIDLVGQSRSVIRVDLVFLWRTQAVWFH